MRISWKVLCEREESWRESRLNFYIIPEEIYNLFSFFILSFIFSVVCGRINDEIKTTRRSKNCRFLSFVCLSSTILWVKKKHSIDVDELEESSKNFRFQIKFFLHNKKNINSTLRHDIDIIIKITTLNSFCMYAKVEVFK